MSHAAGPRLRRVSAVRPEFGPTLPELVAPRLARLPRGARLALAASVALVVVAAAAALATRGTPPTVSVHQPVGFRFQYLRPFHQRRPHPGELARVSGGGQSFVVRELRLPAYRGDSAGFLPLYASGLNAEMARRLPGYQWRAEGRANINHIQGYEILFRYRRAGGRWMLGRRELLLPTSTARRGVDLLLLAHRTKTVRAAGDVGDAGAMKRALRSFVLDGASQS